MTGIPITNVNNNCSTGSTALYNTNLLVKGGLIECGLALGFERMNPGSLGTNFPDRPSPIALFNSATVETEEHLSAGENHGPGAPRIFANAGQEYFDKYGASIEHLAQIGICFPIHVSMDEAYSEFVRMQHPKITSTQSIIRTLSSVMDGPLNRSSRHPKSTNSLPDSCAAPHL